MNSKLSEEICLNISRELSLSLSYIRWVRSLMLEECWENHEHHERHGSVTGASQDSLECHESFTGVSRELHWSVTGASLECHGSFTRVSRDSRELHWSVTGASLGCQYALRRNGKMDSEIHC